MLGCPICQSSAKRPLGICRRTSKTVLALLSIRTSCVNIVVKIDFYMCAYGFGDGGYKADSRFGRDPQKETGPLLESTAASCSIDMV